MSCLRNNARESLTRMSKITHIPVSTIYDRLRVHEASLIKKHTSLIDFSRLGYHARANVTIKVDREYRKDFVKHVAASQHTNSLFKINNGFDYLAEFVFRNVRELEDYIELLEHRFHIPDKTVYIIVEDIKQEGFLSDRNMIGLV